MLLIEGSHPPLTRWSAGDVTNYVVTSSTPSATSACVLRRGQINMSQPERRITFSRLCMHRLSLLYLSVNADCRRGDVDRGILPSARSDDVTPVMAWQRFVSPQMTCHYVINRAAECRRVCNSRDATLCQYVGLDDYPL